ncbi:MAG: hypothetical protein E7265_05785 [Lachnospiraceae bacterium]|nr:hypothetical protein [Lachnospiraceae bacterium]
MNKDNKHVKVNISSITKWFKDKNIGTDKMLLLGLAGVILIISPMFSGKKNNSNNEASTTAVNYEMTCKEYAKYMEERVCEIIKNVEGAGNVKVMINFKSTSEKIVLTESPYSYNETNEEDGAGGFRTIYEENNEEKVIYDSDDSPYITKEVLPEILGVAVIADGGENPVVKEKIINVIKALFDLSINKIAVVGNGG